MRSISLTTTNEIFIWKGLKGSRAAIMQESVPQKDPALQECWPDFLDLIDSNPNKANDSFARYLCKIFSIWIPPRLRGFPKDRHLDFTQDCYIEFTKNNYRKLRLYQNRGKPFASWFLVACSNLAQDWAAKSRNIESDPMPQIAGNDEATDELWNVIITKAAGPKPDQETGAIWKELLRIASSFMKELDRRQQLLLTLSAEGYEPREIVKLLGESPERNKAISDDIRYARSKLRQMLDDYLKRGGMNLSDYFGS
jgi:RNA polymerase sigma factor (sigma-70 family)